MVGGAGVGATAVALGVAPSGGGAPVSGAGESYPMDTTNKSLLFVYLPVKLDPTFALPN